MTTFLLIRHGETDAVGKSIMGWRPGWHLNETGKAQAERLGIRLSQHPLKAIYTSPLERAVETAGYIAKPHRLTPQRVEAFGEVHAGDFEGHLIADLDQRDDWRRFNTFRSGTRAPAGELMSEVQNRMVTEMLRLQGRHAGETVAVVSHGDPLRAAVAYFMGIPLDLTLRFEISPASLSVLELSEWGSRMLCVNDTGEVPL